MHSVPRALRRVVSIGLALLVLAGSVTPAAALSSDYPYQSHANRGSNVRAFQYLLRHHGSTIAVTGLFDTATRTATRAFQATSDLPQTGAADRETWTAIKVPLATGATSDAVRALQGLLNEKRNATLLVTGRFETATRAAVVAFQRHAGLDETGKADASTWKALLAHLETPVFGSWLCDYSVGNGAANWGTGSTIGQLEVAASRVTKLGHGRVAVGDIGWQHGGDIPGHQSHEHGMDVDLRPMRTNENQCSYGTNWRYTSYDRAATRDLVKAIRASAVGHVKLIYFNDPVLIREGLTIWYSGHDDHLHVRYCEVVHAVAAYRC